MEKKKRKCMAPGCHKRVEADHLCCLDHWWKLPPITQRGVSERLFGWMNAAAAREYLACYYARAGKERAA